MSNLSEIEKELEEIGENIDRVIDDSVLNAEIGTEFTMRIATNLIFFGKSLALWEDELHVPIPEGTLTPQILTDLWIDLANKIQIADHYLALSRASESISSANIEIKKSEIATALIAYFNANNNKTPPNTVIDRMAENYVRKLTSINTTTKVVRDFWKAKVTTLKDVSSILNSIAMSNAVQMKYAGD